ncbi:hypothetical protein DSO57_1004875 [Entomophthora muscae]|uniref:Uncharacterized protein n=1 Tax=Entomophthora muscae TaxID=34485 RepID=A0ACC2RZB1_9FUNG|nr:hypothetical protein DSO57_1004875 [Entomophthora muscae]
MSCLTLQVSANTRDSRYGTIDKRMSTPCLSSYYTLPPNFEPSDDCIACPSYYDSPIPLCENVYSRIMPFVTRRVQCESLTLLRKLMISPKLHRFNATDVGVELAIGSSGTVVLAKLPSESSHDFEQVAIKLFNPLQPLQLEEEYFQQHAYEIYIACMMEHENIVHAHRATYQDRQLGLFMEYCPHDFFNLIASDTLTPSQIDDFFYQMISGVRFLHRNGIAHRDLKLDNFMVTAEGTLKIVDFGFACITRSAGRDTPLLSQGLWGSDPYMAPEIFTGSEYDAEKADVWSLGIIYLTCCINRFPWEVATEEDFSLCTVPC